MWQFLYYIPQILAAISFVNTSITSHGYNCACVVRILKIYPLINVQIHSARRAAPACSLSCARPPSAARGPLPLAICPSGRPHRSPPRTPASGHHRPEWFWRLRSHVQVELIIQP